MLRPDDLYEIVDESVATGPAAAPKVLVHSLDGFMDAGRPAGSPPTTCSKYWTAVCWRDSTSTCSTTTGRVAPR